jgi:hypothetical protein
LVKLFAVGSINRWPSVLHAENNLIKNLAEIAHGFDLIKEMGFEESGSLPV